MSVVTVSVRWEGGGKKVGAAGYRYITSSIDKSKLGDKVTLAPHWPAALLMNLPFVIDAFSLIKN